MLSEAYKDGRDAVRYAGPTPPDTVWDALVLRYLDGDAPMLTLRLVWASILLGASGGRSPMSVPESDAAKEATQPEATEAAQASAAVYGVPNEGPAPADAFFTTEYLTPVREAGEERETRVSAGLALGLAVLFLLAWDDR